MLFGNVPVPHVEPVKQVSEMGQKTKIQLTAERQVCGVCSDRAVKMLVGWTDIAVHDFGLHQHLTSAGQMTSCTQGQYCEQIMLTACNALDSQASHKMM